MKKMSHPLKNFIFLGNDEFSVSVAEILRQNGFLPETVVVSKPAPAGRGLIPKEPILKKWADNLGINTISTEKLSLKEKEILSEKNPLIFVVASFGKIIPLNILSIPKMGAFNIHPSLLPKYRGPSPIQTQIMSDEKEIGVSIIKMDEKVDHGEIISQKKIEQEEFGGWPAPFSKIGKILFEKGAYLLIESLPKLASGEIIPKKQDENKATLTKKISKKDGEIHPPFDQESCLRFMAFGENPGVFFFTERKGKKIRVKITEAKISGTTLEPIGVIPEGKRLMAYEDFLRGA